MKIPEDFIKYIEAKCEPDESTGNLICKNCKHKVLIDWFEMSLDCLGCDEL